VALPPFCSTFVWSFEPWRHFADRPSQAHKFPIVFRQREEKWRVRGARKKAVGKPKAAVQKTRLAKVQIKLSSCSCAFRLVSVLAPEFCHLGSNDLQKHLKFTTWRRFCLEMNEDKLQKWPRRWRFFGQCQ